ncbi:MAG: hypothetical protein FWH47_05020 [Methanomassiliicoccaceae archaeon]|nr:hypothetical protein [Methanomassiliicoccaceae archaeon]
MRSKCAEGYDMRHNRLQWMGEEYMMEELVDEQGGRLATGRQYQREAMYWIGYIYRYWHFITGESSRRISMRAPAKVMAMGYPGFHTEDAALAIDDLMRVAKERGRPHQKRGGR